MNLIIARASCRLGSSISERSTVSRCWKARRPGTSLLRRTTGRHEREKDLRVQSRSRAHSAARPLQQGRKQATMEEVCRA